jgi:hypothetical protein
MKSIIAPGALFVVLFGALSLQAGADKLDRAQLLFYEEGGKVHPVRTVADWEKRRAAILRAMEEVMGPPPGADRRCPLDLRVEEEVDCGSYVRRLISYAAEPEGRVPAYLLIPKDVLKSGERAPAVLSLHPTNAKGMRVTVGLANYPNSEYAVELAKRGFVCLAPPYPLLSDYNPDLKKLGYQSGTMKAIWDNRRGLDVLDTLAFVKPGAYAAIGHSLGGHNAIYTAAFDERIKVAVSNCGLDSYRDYMKGNIKGWTSDRYMPKLLGYPKGQTPFDFHEVVAAIAPRRVLIIAPKQDTNFQWWSAAAVAKAARDVFALYKAEANLRIEHPDVGHVFTPEMREEAYRFIAAGLK